MKILIITILALILNHNLNPDLLNAQTNPVSITDRGTYIDLILDFTTGVSHYEMGIEVAKNILTLMPDLEARTDLQLFNRTANFPYDTSLSRMNDIRPQIPPDYKDEIEGIASVICSSDESIRNDGKLSKDELYMSFLTDDIFQDFQCSSISVFGNRSENGSSLTGRLVDGNDTPENQKALTQAVITVKMNNRSYCHAGTLSIGAVTGFNENGVFAAIHSCNVGTKYTTKNKRSYMMDVRYALEHFSTSDEMAEFFAANSNNYSQNRLIQLTDEHNTRILEINISGDGENMRTALRTDTSALIPAITWNYPGAIVTANSFALKGNHDNHTTRAACYERWNTFSKLVPLYGDKISREELKQIASFDNGDGPDLQSEGDIYNVGTEQIFIFQPDSLYLEIAFKPRTGILPDDPVFERIPVYINKKNTGVQQNTEAPSDFYLEQNFPNPFNATTNFVFRIEDLRLVQLKIYDVPGNEIAYLLNEWKEPGNYKIHFDAGSLPSGIYFCTLNIAGLGSKSIKMALIK